MRIRFKLWIVISVIIIVLFSIKYFLSKKDYKIKFNEFTENNDVLNYTMPYQSYFSENFEYPENIEKLKEFYLGSVRYNELLNHLKDPFLKKDGNFLYVPVYSKFNKLREGYLLISAGIDRGIDNIVNDTIYFNNLNSIKFYNDITISQSWTYREFEYKFNFKDYLFGSRDLLVEYVNGVDIFINNFKERLYTPTSLMNKLHPKGFSKFDCCVEGQVKRINDDTIIIFDSKYNVICNMYKGRKTDFEESDIIKIVGQYKNKIDTLKNNVYLDNCIVLVN